MLTLNNSLRKKCKRINELFETPSFFEILSQHSNNEFNTLVENIAKIISYYLSTNDDDIAYPITSLLYKANNTILTNQDYLIYPSNNFYKKFLMLNGLNSYNCMEKIKGMDLNKLDTQLSLYPRLFDDYHSQIYTDIETAIRKSFTAPSVIFESILKQPLNKELPIVVGAEEKTYYKSILDLRLKNASAMMEKTCSTIGKKIIKHIIGNNCLLAIFPKSTKSYQISSQEITNNSTSKHISPIYLAFINIPTKYQLISICANNKNLCNGELLDIKNGTSYVTPSPINSPLESVIYSRYELVSVTDNFIYTNPEFSGDINYDIDLIYGQLDANNRRGQVKEDFGYNFDLIKQRDDIIVRKHKKGYEIRNGRHRILYVKHFYTQNYESYKQEYRIEKLEKYVTIPMNVEHTLDDDIANEYVLKISDLSKKINFYKTDINNEETNLIININGYVFSVNSTSELIELYNYLKDSQYNNQYFIGKNDPSSILNYELIFDTMILTLKEEIFKMTFLDIINYLKEKGITIENVHYSFKELNYHQLYYHYIDLSHKIQMNKIFEIKRDIIKSTENKYKLEEVGLIIMNILHNNKDLIDISWQELYELIKDYPQFIEYDEDFLYAAASSAGYQDIKLEYIYNKINDVKKLKK